MTIEQLMRAVLSASPSQRREMEEILSGKKREHKKEVKQETRLITISGAARLLAVGRNTIYRLVDTKRLDTVELNGCSRVTMRSINAFLDGERPANRATEELIHASRMRYCATHHGKGD